LCGQVCSEGVSGSVLCETYNGCMTLEPAFSLPWRVRTLTVADVPGLQQVQAACYGDEFIERSEVFERRLSVPQQCSIGLVRDGEAGLYAYAVAYWSALGKVTPLNGDFTEAERTGQLLYVHDVSVLPLLSGQGVARHLIEALLTQASARGIAQTALVSVQGSQGYWQRFGFRPYALNDPRQQENLATYGSDAIYMLRTA
jgi:GNAT superfamily N-acetyltransferase